MQTTKTTPKTTMAVTTLATLTPCNKKCENGGTLDSAACNCGCLNPYSGPQCEIGKKNVF